jgi:radical SAM protein with 4Fe4S-binding SPASM domain
MSTQLVQLGMGLVGGRHPGPGHGACNVFQDNLILNDPEFQQYLTVNGRSRPVMLICETTNICNNDCVFCPYGIMDRKKSIMPLALFEKVLADYSEMGGGALSLTPMVGDVFLDKLLPQRIQLIQKHERITRVSITTNATFADRYSDEDLARIVGALDKIHISIYGITPEEHALSARRNDYERVLASIGKVLRVRSPKTLITFGFRVLRKYEDAVYRKWIQDHFQTDVLFGATCSYANWGGRMNDGQALPWDAEWMGPRQNTRQCLLPLIACQVFVNGDVSFCPCCDYDALPEFALGNLQNHSLLDLYNTPRVRRLWNWEEKGNMPDYCKQCTFHLSLDELPKCKSMFLDPIGFMGG